MPIEKSHGRTRLTRPRLTDVGQSGPTPEPPRTRSERHVASGQNRGTKEVSKAAAKALAGEQTRRALPSATTPEASRLVAQNALQLYGDITREVGTATCFVANYAMRYSVNASLSAFFTQCAGEAGFDSKRGITMLEAAHRCEARSERAMIAIEAALKAFSRKESKDTDVPWLVVQETGK